MIDRLDLALSEEERLLRDTTRRALDGAAPHRRLTTGGEAVDMWPLARALGWPGLLVPEAAGGLGMPLSSAALVAEEIGRGLFCGPFSTTAVLAPALFADRMSVLQAIAGGEMAVSLACGPGELADPQRISGRWDLVEHPHVATHFLVFHLRRRTGNEIELTAALVDSAAAQGRSHDLQPFDVTCPVGRLELDRVAAIESRRSVLADDAVDDLLRPFHVTIAAELVGVARAAIERATAYAKERQQFGVPIGSFQAIKHRLADAYVQVESAALSVRQAALDGDTGSALAARALASEAALKATRDCVQVHGGIGFSWECDVHLYLKRARRLVTVLARLDQLRRKVADRLVARVLGAA